MKYVKQFLIISAICLIGELCRYILPFPIPSSIYGLILLLTGLLTGLIKLEHSCAQSASGYYADYVYPRGRRTARQL